MEGESIAAVAAAAVEEAWQMADRQRRGGGASSAERVGDHAVLLIISSTNEIGQAQHDTAVLSHTESNDAAVGSRAADKRATDRQAGSCTA